MLASEFNPTEVIKFTKENFKFITWVEEIKNDNTLILRGFIGSLSIKILIKNSFKTLKLQPLDVSLWVDEDLRTYCIDDEKEIDWTLDDFKLFIISSLENIRDRNERTLLFINNALSEHKDN